MQTTMIGRRAEEVAAEYLERRGYAIIGRNWRQRDCEIDVIAQKDGCVHFVEVKYRSSDIAGSGLEYIDSKKLLRMSYAAQRWTHANRWRGPYVLSAVEVSDALFEVTEYIESIEG